MSTILIVFMGITISVYAIIYFSRRRKRERKVYEEVTLYMEQLLCSYRRLGNVTLALQDCYSVFEGTSQMRYYLSKVNESIMSGGFVSDGFRFLESKYDSRRLRMLHDFLERTEHTGGDIRDALDILLHDLQMWKQRTELYQKRKEYIQRECFLAIFLSFLMCLLSVMLIPISYRNVLLSSFMYPLSMGILVAVYWFLIWWVERRLTGSWLDSEARYDNQNEYLLVRQGKRGIRYLAAESYCKKEVREEFPYWILLMVLYLQQESVYQAVKLTCQRAKGIFQTELKSFLEELYEEPASLNPYMNFFSKLRLPEIQTGMKILYSVNVNGYTDSKRQIWFLVEEMNRLMDQSQQRKFENETNYMGFWRQLPMLAAGGKILWDAFMVIRFFWEGVR